MYWGANKRAEQDYFAHLWQLFKKFNFDPVRIIQKQEFFDLWAEQAAERMIVGQLASSARTWRGAARENMRGAQIYKALRSSDLVNTRVNELVAENAKLIKSLPKELAARVAVAITEKAQQGERASTMQIPGLFARAARWRIRLITRTETSKATTALTQARAEELDLDWYVWRTSKDARVRVSHRKMDGVLFRWSDPPAPESLVGQRSTLGHYHAGNAPNDRCYPEPILNLGQVSWPHRVYWNGTIHQTSLMQFKNLNRIAA